MNDKLPSNAEAVHNWLVDSFPQLTVTQRQNTKRGVEATIYAPKSLCHVVCNFQDDGILVWGSGDYGSREKFVFDDPNLFTKAKPFIEQKLHEAEALLQLRQSCEYLSLPHRKYRVSEFGDNLSTLPPGLAGSVITVTHAIIQAGRVVGVVFLNDSGPDTLFYESFAMAVLQAVDEEK